MSYLKRMKRAIKVIENNLANSNIQKAQLKIIIKNAVEYYQSLKILDKLIEDAALPQNNFEKEVEK